MPGAGPKVKANASTGRSFDDPSEALLRELLDDIEDQQESYLILERVSDPAGETFAQVIKDEEGWLVEHRAGCEDRHFHVLVADVADAHGLLWHWLSGDAGLNSIAPWTHLSDTVVRAEALPAIRRPRPGGTAKTQRDTEPSRAAALAIEFHGASPDDGWIAFAYDDPAAGFMELARGNIESLLKLWDAFSHDGHQAVGVAAAAWHLPTDAVDAVRRAWTLPWWQPERFTVVALRTGELAIAAGDPPRIMGSPHLFADDARDVLVEACRAAVGVPVPETGLDIVDCWARWAASAAADSGVVPVPGTTRMERPSSAIDALYRGEDAWQRQGPGFLLPGPASDSYLAAYRRWRPVGGPLRWKDEISALGRRPPGAPPRVSVAAMRRRWAAVGGNDAFGPDVARLPDVKFTAALFAALPPVNVSLERSARKWGDDFAKAVADIVGLEPSLHDDYFAAVLERRVQHFRLREAGDAQRPSGHALEVPSASEAPDEPGAHEALSERLQWRRLLDGRLVMPGSTIHGGVDRLVALAEYAIDAGLVNTITFGNYAHQLIEHGEVQRAYDFITMRCPTDLRPEIAARAVERTPRDSARRKEWKPLRSKLRELAGPFTTPGLDPDAAWHRAPRGGRG